MKNKLRNITLALPVAALLAVPAHAQNTTVDLTAVTDGVSALKVALLSAAGAVIAAGIGLMAVKFGGKWVVRVFKSFSS